MEYNFDLLYLSGLIKENQQIDINQIATQMQFLPTSKKKLTYQFSQDLDNMPAMSYTVAQEKTPVVTVTSDGKETQNTAEPNDIIMSGLVENYMLLRRQNFPNYMWVKSENQYIQNKAQET